MSRNALVLPAKTFLRGFELKVRCFVLNERLQDTFQIVPQTLDFTRGDIKSKVSEYRIRFFA